MKKKQAINYFSYIPIITLVVSMIVGYVRFQAKAEETAVKVKEVKEDVKEIEKKTAAEIEKVKEANDKEVKELEEKNAKLDKNITEQNVKLEYIQLLLEKVSDKIDKKK